MMVSDFIVMVGRLINTNISGLIMVAIISIIVGAVPHKVATSIQSSLILTLASLFALLFWVHLWDIGETMWGTFFTISIAVTGWEIYRRLLAKHRF